MITIEKISGFLNYYSVYSCNGYNHKPMSLAICFSEVFNSRFNDKIISNTYQIKMFKPCAKQLEQNHANCCYLSKSDLITYLKSCKIWHSNKAKQHQIKLDDHKDYYLVTVNVTDYQTVHRFILTYLRFAYEFPFSLYLYEAFKIRESGKFNNEYILNLFHLVCTSVNSGFSYCTAHTFIKAQLYYHTKVALYIPDLKTIQRRFSNPKNIYFSDVLIDNFKSNTKLKVLNMKDMPTDDRLKCFSSAKERATRIKEFYLPNYKLILKSFYNNGKDS